MPTPQTGRPATHAPSRHSPDRGSMFAEAILCVYANCRYELPQIIEELKALDADIIALQEVDIACERSNNVDTGEPVTQVNLRSCRHNWTGATLGNSFYYIVQMRQRRRTKPRGVLCARFGAEWLTLSSVQEKRLLGRSAWTTPSSASLRSCTHQSEMLDPRQGAPSCSLQNS